MNEIAIKVDHVYKDFKLPHDSENSLKGVVSHPFKKRSKVETQHALKGISFEVKRGEFFGIVGRNGSGKSTLLKLIAKIYQPTKGSIVVDGRLVPFIELGVGFNPELTGRENVFLNGALMGFSKKEIQTKYDDIVSFSELERFMDQKLKNYSSGMHVRLAFSVATILAESDILLIDEVLAVGDADFQRKCFDYFRSLKKNKKTVVFVSHDMNAVREYCDKAILVDSGSIVSSGKSSSVSRDYDKMFVTRSKKTNNEIRWGDGSVRYTKVDIKEDLITDQDEDITITTTVRVEQDIKDLILGFSIKNEHDVYVLGSNSKLQNITLEDVAKGDKITISWVIPNILGDGNYSVNVAAESASAQPYDWWDDVKTIHVRRGTIPGMTAYPRIKAEVKI